MSLAGAHIRAENIVGEEASKAKELVRVVMDSGCSYASKRDLKHVFRTRQLCYAHAVYLQAIEFALQNKVGSRGSSIVLDPNGEKIHDLLNNDWRIFPENPAFRAKILETEAKPDEVVLNEWVDCHPVPESDSWFETIWADFRKGEIYKTE
jgi:hypothetical protein